MVDATEATESQYLTADIVRNAEIKIVVVLEGGDYKPSKYGKKLTMTVQIDGKNKIWRPNPQSTINLIEHWGKETSNWIGKQARVQVVDGKGDKESIIATPITN